MSPSAAAPRTQQPTDSAAPATGARARVIYISSAARSGSTLLDQLLASHPRIVSVGEALQLKAYALEDRRYYDPVHPLVCSCGQAVRDCPFWSAVQAQLGTALGSLRLEPRFLNKRSPQDGPLTRVVTRTLRRWPSGYRNRLVHALLAGNRLGADGARLFDAIATVTGASHVLDSSKMPFRFWSLDHARPGDVWLILLCRDYRAVAHSVARRSGAARERALARGVHGWRLKLHQMEVLSRDFRRDRVIRVRYEDLCSEPERTLRDLCAFLGLQFVPQVLSRATEDLHHLGGSPSKLAPGRDRIRLDTEYLEHLTAAESAMMREMAGEYATRWGYA